jgi:hypothetical protein
VFGDDCGEDGGVDDGEAAVFIQRSKAGVECRLKLIACRGTDEMEAIMVK